MKIGVKQNGKDNTNTYGLFSNTPPQTMINPRALAKCLAFTEGNTFVSVSAVMLSVEQ